MPDGRQFSAEQSLTSLVAGAIDGYADAWEALVVRLERVVWKSVNMMTFDHEARDDAFAATWLRLAERLDTLAGDDDGDHSRGLQLDESRRDLRAAFGRLDPHCREIITVLVLADPPVPYDQASERLGRPIGSLGPSRRRCLQKMKSLLDGDTTDPPIDHRGAS